MKKKEDELKTLEDMPTIPYADYWWVSESMLRQEAIKHYKAVKNGDLVIDVTTYIRWVNNLTEEDLK